MEYVKMLNTNVCIFSRCLGRSWELDSNKRRWTQDSLWTLELRLELRLDSQINKIWVYTKIWYGVNTKHIKGPIHGFNHNRNLVDV